MKQINLAHGSGGNSTRELINDIFQRHFSNEILDRMEDSAVLTVPAGKIAFTTDSFVVQPLFFKGGDIGKLAVCGTVNDLLMQGAVPKYLSVGFIMEEGLAIDDLTKIVLSMKEAAQEANIKIVTGDTKVVEGSGGVFINTSGIGIVAENTDISSKNVKPGDSIIVSGSLGNHHACILTHRMNIENNIYSDCAPLSDMVLNLIREGICIKSMRDITRGGLATVLNEIADSCGYHINILDTQIPVDSEVKAFCDILGLDPLYMANEGKFLAIVDSKDAEKAVEIIKLSDNGSNAAIIGTIEDSNSKGVTVTTKFGGRRIIDILYGEGLPRIC